MAKSVEVRFEENIAFIHLKREKNQFTHEFLDDLNAALDQVLSNPRAEALVTYATGKNYSQGLDLDTIGAAGLHYGLTFSKKFCEFNARLLTFPMPTIAAINGHAYAGGAVMALCHDYRVMNAEKGWLCLPEVRIRLMFTRTLMEILKSKLPAGNIRRDMVTMGRRLTGPEALEMGVVDQTAPPAEVVQEATGMAMSMLKKNGAYGREAMADMKNDVYSNVVETLGENKFNFLIPQTFRSKV